jgi:hypothetical protein
MKNRLRRASRSALLYVFDNFAVLVAVFLLGGWFGMWALSHALVLSLEEHLR